MLTAGKKAWSLRGRTADGAVFEKDFTAAEMSVTIGVGVVAPGKARRFFVPLDPDVDPKTLTIRLD